MRNTSKKSKIISIILIGIVLAAILTLYFLNFKSINEMIKDNFDGQEKNLLKGLLYSIVLTIVSFIVGLFMGLVTSLIQKIDSNNVFILIIKKIFSAYVAIFRGTPMVIQLLILYFVVFSFFKGDAIYIAIIGFGLNSGAYISEIIRGGINSLPKGQAEAGRSLGLSYNQTMRKIILPQALKNSLPALGNEFVTLFKDTSIVGFIGSIDLSLAFRKIANLTFDYNLVYLVMGVVYFLLVLLITNIFGLVEKKVFKNVKVK